MTDMPCVILGGGAARRMGGLLKGLEPLGGRPILDHVIERMAPQAGPLGLNANADPALFHAYGLPVFGDGDHFDKGPLAGVLAAMTWAKTLGAEAVVTVAWDTPFLPRDLIGRLTSARDAQRKAIAMAASRDAKGQLWEHPTAALWPVSLEDDLQKALTDGVRKVSDWARGNGLGLVEYAALAPDPFFNINTAADLAHAEELLTRGSA